MGMIQRLSLAVGLIGALACGATHPASRAPVAAPGGAAVQRADRTEPVEVAEVRPSALRAVPVLSGESCIPRGERVFIHGTDRVEPVQTGTGSISGGIEGQGERWTLEIAMPEGRRFAAGSRFPAARYPFQTFDQAGPSFSGEGRGCNAVLGEIVVSDVAYAGDRIRSLRASFIHRRDRSGEMAGESCFDLRPGNQYCPLPGAAPSAPQQPVPPDVPTPVSATPEAAPGGPGMARDAPAPDAPGWPARRLA
jgi:hypothetical protein